MDEKVLIDGIIAGDQNMFRLLVGAYREKVYSTCYRFVLNREDARDLAQEVFAEVFTSANRFRHEASLSTWIYRIAANKSLNFLKKNRKNKLTVSLDVLSGKGNDPATDPALIVSDQAIDAREMTLVLEHAIAALPDNQRMAFTLHKYDELPYRQIAEIMEISVSAVESLIHRAKLRLQKQLTNYLKKN